ncbi:hypothetical protein CRG98_045798 [Punica granatum]|uniref:Receptor ligand binding region domain-containing protein n=1 Tax=Punica granatum TaxID=22663 RepID=A0A2I0HQ23_PUNGR|nr:hypothetical protein CRG98_045798 [Punica granatum]
MREELSMVEKNQKWDEGSVNMYKAIWSGKLKENLNFGLEEAAQLFKVKFYYFGEVQQRRGVKLVYCKNKDQLADLFTKSSHCYKVEWHKENIGVLWQSLIQGGTRVFLVHMTASLGSQIFLRARKAGMLNDETVWIVTDRLTSLLDPVGHRAIESMQGAIGVRPHLPMSKQLIRFKKKYPTNELISGLQSSLQ